MAKKQIDIVKKAKPAVTPAPAKVEAPQAPAAKRNETSAKTAPVSAPPQSDIASPFVLFLLVIVLALIIGFVSYLYFTR